MPLLENIHDETRHSGKVPRRAPRNSQQQTTLIQLRNDLKRASPPRSTRRPRGSATRSGRSNTNSRGVDRVDGRPAGRPAHDLPALQGRGVGPPDRDGRRPPPRGPPLRRLRRQGRASSPPSRPRRPGARRRGAEPDRGARRRTRRRTRGLDLSRLRPEIHGVPGRGAARLPERLQRLRPRPAPAVEPGARGHPARRQGGAAAARRRRTGSGSAPGSATPSPAKITRRRRVSATSSASRTPTHEPGRTDPHLRRMAPGHRPRERHRHVLADPPGPQPRRLPVHQPGQPRREVGDRGQRQAGRRPRAGSTSPSSTSTR